jgi:hypothetical protein
MDYKMNPEDMLSRRGRALADVFNVSASVIRAEITEQMAMALQSTVFSGPFAGMKIAMDAAWGDGDVMPKLLGCYEQELHQALSRAVTRRPEIVINIGCAEGYYAVGLARALRAASIIAFDTLPLAQEICRKAAVANGVSDRLKVQGECMPKDMVGFAATPGRKLLVIDCEGAEQTLLVPEVIRGLGDSDVIVECHDFIVPGITAALSGLFASSHIVEHIDQGGRNPSAYESLRQLNELYRWLAINENRPVAMNWLACWSR